MSLGTLVAEWMGMSPYIEQFVEHLRDAEKDLCRDARAFRQSIPTFIRESSVAAFLTTPIIYSLLPVFLVFDAWVTA
jgi:hypothetical protein